jgi:endonuclease-3
MKKSNATEFMKRLAKRIPAPETELNFKNPFTLLVAVVLSAQATDAGVNKATKSLFTAVDTPEKMVALGEAALKTHIRTIGLYNAKAKNIIALSGMLIERHNSLVPDERSQLEALPGVGRKTAGVVLNTVFGQPTIAVDTHVFRVSNRSGLAPGKTPDQVEQKLYKIVPEEYLQHAHHWLILFGRHVCKARAPECPDCVVRELCAFKQKTKA